MPTETTWLYGYISHMAVVMAFLCPLLPNTRDKDRLIFCIKELHRSATAIFMDSALCLSDNSDRSCPVELMVGAISPQNANAIIHFIRSPEMGVTVEKVIRDLENSMEVMKRSPGVSESDLKLVFMEPLEECRTLVYPDGKQKTTGADQSPPWNENKYGATVGCQMTSAMPDLHFSGRDIKGTFNYVADESPQVAGGSQPTVRRGHYSGPVEANSGRGLES
jgi:hypothetical protein